MLAVLSAVLLLAQASTPVSNGDNANQVRASIYDIAIGNQRGYVARPSPRDYDRALMQAQPRRARRAR